MSHTLTHRRRQAPRAPLPPAAAAVIRQLELTMARRLALETDMTLGEALHGVTALHEAGLLRLVTRGDQLCLAPNRRKKRGPDCRSWRRAQYMPTS
jgi:hypothetical protein